ncbi:hypothetical protein [Muricoccus roseus]|uniref:hypothetical protein n=1 Tax=Muricoccus roseus TaxID=198092 RepID=UPI000935260A|nr:hypothetical protein [Roseomonas rosea]
MFRVILQLDPPLPMETSRGAGLAHFMIDYGPESHLMWVVFLNADGACWTVPNPEVRIQANWSMQRRPGEKSFAKPGPAALPMRVDEAPAAPSGHQDGTPLNGYGLNGQGLNGHAFNGHRRYHASSTEL